jgi:tetratricopeptide (TPR) repeat protein
MARRRVNTRFLTIFVSILVAIWVGVYAAQKFLIHDHPGPFIDAGKEAAQEGHWADAAHDLNYALQLDPHNLDVCMMLGAALQREADFDQDAPNEERLTYEHALEVNPRYLPALRALITWWQTYAGPNAYAYARLIDYSQRAHELDPTDQTIAAMPAEMIVQEWVGNLTDDQQAVQQALADLHAFMLKDPSDADIPYHIAKANLFKAQLLTRDSSSRIQPPEATALYNQSVELFEKLINGDGFPSQDSNALMHHRFAMLLELLADFDQSAINPDDPPQVQMQKQKALHDQYWARARQEIERARALVRLKDPAYMLVMNASIEIADQQGDYDDAVKICRTLPPTPSARLNLADLLARKEQTRPEAEQILNSMLARLHDDPNHIAGLRADIMTKMVNYEIVDYVHMSRADDRAKILDRIQTELDQLIAAAPSEVPTADGTYRSGVPLDLRREQARMFLLQGKSLDLVHTFAPLIANDPDISKDPVILTCVADGYANMNQVGRAISVMQDLLRYEPNNLDAQKFLVKLLVHDAPDKAADPLNQLLRSDPNDPDLIGIRIDYLLANDAEQNKPQIASLYPQMPEVNTETIVSKARVAIFLKNFDEAIRLMKLNIANNPKDPSSYANLAFVYLYMGKKDEALDAVNRGIVAAPDSEPLKLLVPSIKGEDPKIIEHLREQLAQANTDPFERELELAEIARDHGDLKGQEKHLKAAEAASPESPRIWNELFTFYLNSGRPDDAAPYVDKLASVDYDQTDGEACKYLVARARGDVKLAGDIARQMTQDKPDLAISWVDMGQISEIQGTYDDAMVDYTSALERQSNNYDAIHGLITCSYALNRPDDAKKYIIQGLSKDPQNQTLRNLLIDNVLTYGNPPDAVSLLQEEINRNPDNPQLYSELGEVYVRVARIADQQLHHDQATALLQNAVDMLQGAVAKWPDDAGLYLVLTDAALAARQPADAERILQTWAKLPAWKLRPEPYLRLADLYERTGHPDAAESQLRTALVRSDYSVDMEADMAQLLAVHKKYDDALELLRGANPDQPQIRLKLIEVLLQAGRTSDAQTQIQDDLKDNPPDRASLNGIWAQLAFANGDYAAAIDHATQSLSQDSSNLQVLYIRGRSRLHASPPDSQGAMDDLKRLHEVQPGNSQVRMDLVSAYLQLQMSDDATTELEAELRSNPGNKAARMMLVSLYCTEAHPQETQALHLLQEVENTPPFNSDADIFQSEAIILSDLQDNADALQKSNQALSLAPHNAAVWHSHLGLMLKAQDYQDVITAIGQADPPIQASWWTLLDRSQAEFNLGSTDAASADCRAALAAADTANDSNAINQIAQQLSTEVGLSQAITVVAPYAKARIGTKLALALMYMRNHDESNALTTIQSVMAGFDQLQRSDQIAALLAAGSIFQAGQTPSLVDQAYQAYQRCLQLDPNNISALNNMACLLADYYSPPRAQEGLTYAQKASDLLLNLGQTDATILDTQGWLLILSGSPADGVDLLNKALDIRPFPTAYFHLGEGYLSLQYADEADKQAQLGLAMLEKQDPKDQDVKLKAKLQDLINRSQDMMKSKQQAQVP